MASRIGIKYLIGGSLAGLFLLGIYAGFIEPQWLETSHHMVSGIIDHEIKIAHLADLHLKKYGSIEKKVIAVLKEEKPSVVFITGDMLDDQRSIPAAKEMFSQFQPPLGVWAVLGNWENWEKFNTEEIFDTIGIKLLINQRVEIEPGFVVYGYDDSFSGHPNREIAGKAESFCVNLFHSPDIFGELKSDCPLSLAGHTHGGQVRVPFWGPLWLPQGSGSFVAGWYDAPLGDSHMYISKGIGTSIAPVRFLTRPEIAFITVEPRK